MALRLRLVARLTAAAAIFSMAAACGSHAEDREEPRQTAGAAAAPAKAAPDARRKIVVLGDSLTAGLGLPVRDAYPALLQERLKTQGLDFEVVNAGVSGDTSAGALSRLDWSLQGDVRVLIIALGGNDGLRGLPAEQLQQNLAQIIERAQARHIEVILAGMEAPPNYGREYVVSFHKVYPALAKRFGIGLVPFLLQGVAGNAALNQADGIHPTASGARIVADNVWTVLKPIAERLGRSGS